MIIDIQIKIQKTMRCARFWYKILFGSFLGSRASHGIHRMVYNKVLVDIFLIIADVDISFTYAASRRIREGHTSLAGRKTAQPSVNTCSQSVHSQGRFLVLMKQTVKQSNLISHLFALGLLQSVLTSSKEFHLSNPYRTLQTLQRPRFGLVEVSLLWLLCPIPGVATAALLAVTLCWAAFCLRRVQSNVQSYW